MPLSGGEKKVKTSNELQAENSLRGSDDEEDMIISPYTAPAIITPAAIARCRMNLRLLPELREVRANVLPSGSWLSDRSLDFYMRFLRDSTKNFDTESVNFNAQAQWAAAAFKGKESIKVIGGNYIAHWRVYHCKDTSLRIYDSLHHIRTYEQLPERERKYIRIRFPTIRSEDVTFPACQRQLDGNSCGLFSLGFATTIALGGDPSKTRYTSNPDEMRQHILRVLQTRNLKPFPCVSHCWK